MSDEKKEERITKDNIPNGQVDEQKLLSVLNKIFYAIKNLEAKVAQLEENVNKE